MDKIEFPKYCNAYNFEKDFINEYNQQIENLNIDNVLIDMKKIQWMDLFSLAITSLIIHFIAKKCKNVFIELPACYALGDDKQKTTLEGIEVEDAFILRKNVCSFFDRWNFFKILNQYSNIKTDIENNIFETWSKSHEYRRSFVLELTSVKTIAKLENVCSLLQDENRVKEMFEEYSSLSVIESGKLANIIIHEVGLNISEHADAEKGYLTMHVVKNIDEEAANSEQRIEYRKRYSTDWDQKYFNENKYSGYIELVIADDGSGIYETLHKNYENNHEGEEYDESDVLEWAFWETSSQKSEKRYEDCSKTGLYWVLRTVSDCDGFISLRSGESVISYNFANNDEPVKPFKKTKLYRIRGTQILIRIPLKDKNIDEKVTHEISKKVGHKEAKEESVKIFNINSEANRNQEFIINELKRFDKYRNSFENNHDVIYLNFQNIDWNKDELNIFFNRLFIIGDSSSVIILNFDYSRLSVLKTTNAFAKFEKQQQLLLIYSTKLELYFLGGNDDIYKIVEYLNNDIDSNEEDFNSYINNNVEMNYEKVLGILNDNTQYFSIGKPYSETERIFRTNINYENAYRALNEITDKNIHEYLTNTGTLIPGYFYFPAGDYYSDKCIITKKLLEDPIIQQYIINEIKIRLKYSKIEPDIILTCTHSGREIAALLSESHQIKRYTYFDNYYFTDADDPVLPINESDKVLILTDVIGTGGLLKRLENYATKVGVKVVGFCAIVDTRNPREKLNRNNCVYLSQITFTKHKVKPEEWKDEKIITVDPQKLISKTDSKDVRNLAILKKDEFWYMIRNSKALKGRHICYRERHYNYYIDNEIIFKDKDFGEKLANKIIDNLKTKVDVVLFPSYSDAKYLVERLNASFMKNEDYTITPKSIRAEYNDSLLDYEYTLPDIQSYDNRFNNKNVLIIDDGINSGKTISELIKIASLYKAKNIQVFVFLNRLSTENTLKLIENLKLYRVKIAFNFLYWFNCPVYTKDNCPFCKKRNKYLEYLKTFHSATAQNQITEKAKLLECTNKNSFIDFSKNILNFNELIENQSNLDLEKIIDQFHGMKDKENAISFLEEESRRILSSEVKDKLVNLCKKIIFGEYKMSVDSRGIAIQLLSRLDNNECFLALKTLTSQIEKYIDNYSDIIISINNLLDMNLDYVRIFQEYFIDIVKEVQNCFLNHAQDNTKYNEYFTRDHYLYVLRQDLRQRIPLKKEDMICESIMFLKNKILPVDHVEGHDKLYISLCNKLSEIVMSRLLNNTGTSFTEYFDDLKQISSDWNKTDKELREIYMLSHRVYKLGDVAPNEYFSTDTDYDNSMIKDIDILSKFMYDLKQDKVTQNDIMNELLAVRNSLTNLCEKLFNKNSSLRECISFYFNDVVKIVRKEIAEQTNNFDKKRIKINQNIKEEKCTILFDKSYLELLINNLFTNSYKYGFENLLYRDNNTVNITIETKNNYIILDYYDNGKGVNTKYFHDLLRTKEKSWGVFHHRIKKYGGYLDVVPDDDSNLHIKIKFMEV